MSKELKQEAMELLKKYPAKQVVYSSGDGNLFFDKTHADNHARTIGAELKEYRREPVNDDGSSSDSDEKKIPAGKAPSAKEKIPAVDSASGDPPAGDPPAGDPPAGDSASGDPPSGDPPAGDPPSGDPPSGDTSAEKKAVSKPAAQKTVQAQKGKTVKK